MRKAIRFPLANAPAPVLWLAAWVFFASAVPAPAHELKDISLISAAGRTHLKLTFAPNGSEGDYPLYFQKTDLTKGIIALSFLETETAYPLGRHPLEAKSPELEEITLKKVTTPSGKNFLGLELKFKQPPLGDAPLQPAPKGVLKVMLGQAKGKYSWSLSASLKAEAAYLSAKAESPPDGKSLEASAGKTAGRLSQNAAASGAKGAKGPKNASASAEPPIPGSPAEKAGVQAGSDGGNAKVTPSSLREVKMIVTSSQADLFLVFNPPLGATFAPRRNAKDSLWLEAALDNAVSGLAQKDYLLPKNGLYKRIKIAVKGGKLQLRIQLAPGGSAQAAAHEDGIALSGPLPGGAGPAFKWTSLKPQAKESESVVETATPVAETATADGPDPVKSAFADGQALESARPGKGLSSSRTFSVGRSAKAMVMYRDSVALKSSPGAKGKLIRKIPIGEKVVRIDNQQGNLRVITGSDTGYIKAGEAVYEDELSKVQEKTIQGRIEAKQAMLAASAAKAAAAQAKEEEKARKAEEIAKQKAEALAAKVLAKAQADSLKADRKARARVSADSAKAALAAAKAAREAAKATAKAQPQEAPEQSDQMQEAPAPSAAGAAKAAGKNPGKPEPAAKTDADNPAGQTAMGGPKLAIADNPELAAKLAQEKLAAEEEKKRVEPEENRVSYNSYGRRDPFIPVEQGSTDNGIDIDQMKVVGIIWQAQQPMAVLEHSREAGVSFTIKEGDPVHNGRVSHITRDAVTFDISEYGIARSYSLKLVSSKEGAKK